MKKKAVIRFCIICLSMVLLLVSLTACSDDTLSSEYEAVKGENAQLYSELDSLQSKIDSLESQLSIAQKKLSATPKPTPTPTPSPTPSPEPTPTPTPKMSKEEFIASCTVGYDYKELSRDPKTYIGKPAAFTGKIVQVMENDGVNSYRINVTEGKYGWDDTIYVTYISGEEEKRFLEDDIVTVYGTMTDLVSYTAVRGNKITIPGLYAKYMEMN